MPATAVFSDRIDVELLFAAEDDSDWNEWIEFFSRTREEDGRRKGLVEIEV